MASVCTVKESDQADASDVEIHVPEPISREVSTQTDETETPRSSVEIGIQVGVAMRDDAVQFPQDTVMEVLKDHRYAGTPAESQDRQPLRISSENETVETGTDEDVQRVDDVQCVVCPEAKQDFVDFNSQPSVTASSQSEYCPDEDDLSQMSQSSLPEVNSVDRRKRKFIVYEENLKELYRFCPSCGSPTIGDVHEVQNEGSQLSIHLTCLNGCSYKWQSQPSLCGTKGEGNVVLTAAIFFSGIHFAKFERFAHCLNLKTISEALYYMLRKKYVFPVVEKAWEAEQANVFRDLLSRENIVLVGDGRCDSPGHCAKYCTYTLMDVQTQKVVDFKVISVSEVANSNVMEIKGFKDALFTVESQGIKVCVISTDRHPQIIKEMRVNHPNKEHQFDPWHLAKSISKKLVNATNKKGCEQLKPWIPSIINHLWWSATTCEGNSVLLKEKWLSVIHHVTNRHDWPGNQFYHKCAHQPYTQEVSRKKKWLIPGSAAHNALVGVVKDKRLLKDIEHLTKCVHTTLLEVYHSMYLKYLPKQMHFTHDAMSKGTMLAALDHNRNVNRPQVSQHTNSPL